MMTERINIATTSETVKELLLELEEGKIVAYLEEEDNSEVVVAQYLNEAGKTPQEMMFRVTLVAEQKTVLIPGKYLSAFILRLHSFKDSNKDYIVGDREDFISVISGKLVGYIKETLAKEETENETETFKAKIHGTKNTGKGMLFANSTSLIRSNNYFMILEEKYPNILFLLCGSDPSEGEQEYVEAFIFQ